MNLFHRKRPGSPHAMMPNHFRSLCKIALFRYQLAGPDVNHHDNVLVDQSAALGETTSTPSYSWPTVIFHQRRVKGTA